MATYTGRIQFLDLEGGVWVLVTPDETYALFRAPKELLKENLEVIISGRIQADIMTTAQVGPVLEVSSFSVVDPAKESF
jgi:hypothetical protein